MPCIHCHGERIEALVRPRVNAVCVRARPAPSHVTYHMRSTPKVLMIRSMSWPRYCSHMPSRRLRGGRAGGEGGPRRRVAAAVRPIRNGSLATRRAAPPGRDQCATSKEAGERHPHHTTSGQPHRLRSRSLKAAAASRSLSLPPPARPSSSSSSASPPLAPAPAPPPPPPRRSTCFRAASRNMSWTSVMRTGTQTQPPPA